MRRSTWVILAVALLAGVRAVQAQGPGGCVDSPENPTAVLALMGGAGAVLSMVRARWKR
ncbi:MAG: PExPT-CTERM protein [Acidobacteriota bacterium]|nr:PExPT-CTERM protein [Acidobacteriota bacterium]